MLCERVDSRDGGMGHLHGMGESTALFFPNRTSSCERNGSLEQL